jgi:hypothetical protein
MKNTIVRVIFMHCIDNLKNTFIANVWLNKMLVQHCSLQMYRTKGIVFTV